MSEAQLGVDEFLHFVQMLGELRVSLCAKSAEATPRRSKGCGHGTVSTHIGLYWGYLGIMEKKMETTIMGYIHARGERSSLVLLVGFARALNTRLQNLVLSFDANPGSEANPRP